MNLSPRYKNILNRATWLKALYLILCGWLLTVIIPAISLLSLIQFLHLLFTGAPHDALKELSGNLHDYTHKLIGFLCFQIKQPPFPFA